VYKGKNVAVTEFGICGFGERVVLMLSEDTEDNVGYFILITSSHPILILKG
jgi:hypothetical protein